MSGFGLLVSMLPCAMDGGSPGRLNLAKGLGCIGSSTIINDMIAASPSNVCYGCYCEDDMFGWIRYIRNSAI